MWIFRGYRVPNSRHRPRPHCHRPTPFRQAVYMIETVTCVAKPLFILIVPTNLFWGSSTTITEHAVLNLSVEKQARQRLASAAESLGTILADAEEEALREEANM